MTTEIKDGTVFKNTGAYEPAGFAKIVELKVTVMLDPLPGAWNHPRDIIEWINKHSYVQSVEFLGCAS